MIDVLRQTRTRISVVMTIVVTTAVVFMLAGCNHGPVMSQARFVHLPDAGWLHDAPLTFSPEYPDTMATYSLMLAVRHTNSYPYCNLSLVVDMIAADSAVTRRQVDMKLADEYGNWLGGGFGSLYQETIQLVAEVNPDDARSIVVWQAMQGCDTLAGLTDIGLFAKPL